MKTKADPVKLREYDCLKCKTPRMHCACTPSHDNPTSHSYDTLSYLKSVHGFVIDLPSIQFRDREQFKRLREVLL